MKIVFGTKAENLKNLAPLIRHAKVLPQLCFTVQEWRDNSAAVFKQLDEKDWLDTNLIVRSSGLAEDSTLASLAGHFTSVANVSGRESIRVAITEVIQSFGDSTLQNQVFIQPMLQDVQVSGVAFSRDPRNGGFYYVVNYDERSGTTDSITSGNSNEVNTLYVDKIAKKLTDTRFTPLIQLMDELESLYGYDSMDIEFAVSKNQLYLLQVRPLLIKKSPVLSRPQHTSALSKIADKIKQHSRPHPYLHGKRSVFGIMPDWNPAEIIGVRPKPLALSAYKDLITDNVWAYQRNNYGYLNLRSFPLLISFEGLPYIDVRVSFNSFIPANIEKKLADRLVNHYVERLIDNPTHHDKVEFEVIYSCYTLDLDQRLNKLREHGFSNDDCIALAESLRELTNKIIHKDGLWKVDIEKIQKLQERQKRITASDLTTVEKIYWLLEDCKRYGTLPFAGLARAGFIAVQMLKSLVTASILTERDYGRFMNSLDTVSSRMPRDMANLDNQTFLEKYGHLRPGTYDITSKRYDESPEQYFNWKSESTKENQQTQVSSELDHSEFNLSLSQMNKLEALLKLHKIEHGVISLFNFIKEAIEGREMAKFIFTRSLSEALRQLGEIGARYGISREELSYADINVVGQLYGSSIDTEALLRQSIEKGKAQYDYTCQINLPPLITSEQDVYSFEMPHDEPNYITLNRVSGKVVSTDTDKHSLQGNILMVPSADPGYDWIFSHNVGGFITMYGGANSHMAIRAGELGVPAVIGAGEALFQKWSTANRLEIDCAKQSVTVFR